MSRTVKFIENPLPCTREEAKELPNQEKTTKQPIELELEHEENQTVEEGETDERTEVNPCEDEESNSQKQKEKQKEYLLRDSLFLQIRNELKERKAGMTSYRWKILMKRKNESGRQKKK
ncbi:hypothetical protein AVEN_199284-1 [Araneus ventricosus]|uniref:Uncharacterized protein n=1 Tax=Araneus ventricosus TaxID=182803 RepID=A0A4Y2RPM9_ARAVE|nr:hypothetical protein AVEN_199284-1 [Araneus ventricosus]